MTKNLPTIKKKNIFSYRTVPLIFNKIMILIVLFSKYYLIVYELSEINFIRYFKDVIDIVHIDIMY